MTITVDRGISVETITASETLLRTLVLHLGEAARSHRERGYYGLADDAEKMAMQIFTAIEAAENKEDR